MPLTVDLSVNGRRIDSLVIARLEKLKEHDREYTYQVTDGNGAFTLFTHVYSDGARECVRKALESLERLDG
jgi:hypothetical protein